MKNAFFLLIILLLATACPSHTLTETPPAGAVASDTLSRVPPEEPTVTEEEDFIEVEDFWVSSVKGHVNPGSKINNEVNEMWIDLSWTPEKGSGKVELVPAMRFVYEGDLDRDGIPDFGILLKRMSNCCSYALLTIQDGRWALMKYPYGVSYNLRASGKELARRGAKKGEIIITQSDYSDFPNSNCWEAPIKDSVILFRRIDAQDYFSEQN